jgi:hypothetical protein
MIEHVAGITLPSFASPASRPPLPAARCQLPQSFIEIRVGAKVQMNEPAEPCLFFRSQAFQLSRMTGSAEFISHFDAISCNPAMCWPALVPNRNEDGDL